VTSQLSNSYLQAACYPFLVPPEEAEHNNKIDSTFSHAVQPPGQKTDVAENRQKSECFVPFFVFWAFWTTGVRQFARLRRKFIGQEPISCVI
jgi:hypothetical protein